MSYDPFGGQGPPYPTGGGGGYPGGVPQHRQTAPPYPPYGQAPPAGFSGDPNRPATGYPPYSTSQAGYPAAPGGPGYPAPSQAGYPTPSGQPAPPVGQQSGYPGTQPSGYPAQQPSGYPAQQPAGYPAQQPSGYPAQQPAGYPAQQPSGYPAQQPSGYPGQQSGGYPGKQPGGNPGKQPGGYPGKQPGGYPDQQPGGYPGQQPGGYPGKQPGGYPDQQPGGYPDQQPGGYPGKQPGGYPDQQPGGYPGQQPGGYPSQQPGGYPGKQPAGYPDQQPGGYPGKQPAGYPGQQPAGHPGRQAGEAASTRAAPTATASPGSATAGLGSAAFRPGNNWYLAKFSGTIRASPSFDAASDAHALRKAMKGLGTDEKAIIMVLCKRSNAQRQQIAVQYKSGYGRDLIKDLKSELGGKFEDVILGLMMPPYQYLAHQLNKAMEGMGTDEDVLFETLCTHNNAEIRAIKDAFQKMYGRPLENAVRSESSDHFKRLLTAILQANRDESGQVDQAKAANQAQALYKAGEKKMGTDEETFNVILATQNPAQIHAIMAEYEKLSKKGFIKAIETETSGDYRHALMAIVKCALNRTAYFAERLRDTMKGAGTRDNDLIRLVVARSEYDLANIKQEYLKLYGKTLEKDIASETSGDYKRALVMIVEGN